MYGVSKAAYNQSPFKHRYHTSLVPPTWPGYEASGSNYIIQIFRSSPGDCFPFSSCHCQLLVKLAIYRAPESNSESGSYKEVSHTIAACFISNNLTWPVYVYEGSRFSQTCFNVLLARGIAVTLALYQQNSLGDSHVLCI